ncbi:MAG: phosphoglycerate kinase [Candidatus Portnoybacteria bacterium CG10_big_fil_rev_8_21_14_0_10_36_7]|uniref:Phosphoglycerate kinase n=1 Tax=Candidatus Portnoybacteria bacterium CG10_big_fil_rev_8_21_14_0_10_36_7 TaxID=1974812 RepID=A0A2M8KDA6_9BACT|nr:MAG: phosphoglycerate kinase [Candidatus Portnoybacteria bacterium CG10_big_fil_rev_8_21_14_0_10_36_7]
MKTVRDIDVVGKKVLLRCDLNLSINPGGSLGDNFRVKVSLPTIKYLIEKKAKVIIITHFGRPGGKIDPAYSLEKIAKQLEKFLELPVAFIDDCIGRRVKEKVNALVDGDILMLENLRFYLGEETDDEVFAKELSSIADVFINDAFGVSHRAHASTVGVTKFLPSVAGLLLEKEVNTLSELLNNYERPLSVVIGGAKISTKIGFIQSFLDKADHVLLGGALANTVLHAKGIAIGKSYIEKNMTEEVNKLTLTDIKLHLPVDAIVSADKTGKTADIHNDVIGKTKENDLILDIGEDTERLFSEILINSKTIIWNGPLGYIEVDAFAHGTKAIAETILSSGVNSYIGGGESIAYLEKNNLLDKFTHVSSGGGAMLELLSGMTLPGVEALNI